MPLGSPYLPDTISHAAGNGQHQELTAAQLSTKYGAGNLKTSSANFTIRVGGHLVAFRKNVPMVVSAEVSAALTAAGAPVV